MIDLSDTRAAVVAAEQAHQDAMEQLFPIGRLVYVTECEQSYKVLRYGMGARLLLENIQNGSERWVYEYRVYAL